MRLTIVDVQMGVVQDYVQVGAVTGETFAQVMEWAEQYRNPGYRWLVTPGEEVPAHTQIDAYGIAESFARIRRNRACYRCGASPVDCECPDEMEPDGAR